MSDDRLLYTRQVRLPEVGEAGQARLAAATAPLGAAGFARTIEAKYLERAGLATVESGTPASVDVASLGLQNEAAREVGEGALRALAVLRNVLLGDAP